MCRVRVVSRVLVELYHIFRCLSNLFDATNLYAVYIPKLKHGVLTEEKIKYGIYLLSPVCLTGSLSTIPLSDQATDVLWQPPH